MIQDGGLVFGVRPFLLYRSGFHVPQPCSKKTCRRGRANFPRALRPGPLSWPRRSGRAEEELRAALDEADRDAREAEALNGHMQRRVDEMEAENGFFLHSLFLFVVFFLGGREGRMSFSFLRGGGGGVLFLPFICSSFFSPTAESFGVSAQIGSGVVWGGPAVWLVRCRGVSITKRRSAPGGDCSLTHPKHRLRRRFFPLSAES